MENKLSREDAFQFIEGMFTMAVLDQQGRYIYVNPGWVENNRSVLEAGGKLRGLNRPLRADEILGERVWDVVPESKAAYVLEHGVPLIGEPIAPGETFTTYIPRYGPDGTYETTDFAVDDVVLYTYSYKLDGAKYEGIQSVTKAAAKITGNLSEVTLGKNATVGSTKYDFSKKIANVADTTMLKYDVDVILDSYGYAIDIQPTNTNTAYAYVLNVKADAGDFNSTAKAELLFTDGTTQVVSLNNNADAVAHKVYTKGTNSDGTDDVNILKVGDIVKYQVNNADKYTLERVAQQNAKIANVLKSGSTYTGLVAGTQTSNGS